jgi:hypothetical protein
VLDGDAAGVDVEVREQCLDGHRAADLERLSVQAYRHELPQ